MSSARPRRADDGARHHHRPGPATRSRSPCPAVPIRTAPPASRSIADGTIEGNAIQWTVVRADGPTARR
ncbi:MAG: hypothetical protein M0C28_41935 [Candidatus Moduliflexus flocculans]|nr:hypothetical protein [Candidatus Moduliflexus flocculans]